MAKKPAGHLFETITHEDMVAATRSWTTPDLSEVAAVVEQSREIFLDFETSGLRWWDKDRIVGGAVRAGGRSWYLPVRHKGSDNVPEPAFFDFLRRIRGKRIVNIRTKFDLHMGRADGVNLEEQGNTFGDVAHYAALLDDHRRLFNQADLVKAFLPEEATAKVRTAHGFELDMSRVAAMPAGIMAVRACHDVESVERLQAVMWPQLTEQNLHAVREVEDGVIPVVVEMEHNGAPIDQELLAAWIKESEADLEQAMYEVQRFSGCKLATPDSRTDIEKMFRVLNIEPPRDPEDASKVSYADALLKPFEEHTSERVRNTISALRKAKQVASVRAKFLLRYQKSTLRDGILRYELHQLPYQDDDGGGGGAVSGRFSSAAPSRDEGANIQQVFGVGNQKKFKKHTAKWIIRRLFRPGPELGKDAVWFCADAKQLQYRIFAHYSDSPKILDSYKRDPLIDYHELVQTLVRTLAHVELNRTHTKNVNFAQVFGAGIRKLASQLGVPPDQIPPFGSRVTPSSGGPDFQRAYRLSETYHEMFPEVRPLLALASHLAMPGHDECGSKCRELLNKGYPHRGFVTSILGRRARFHPGDRFYSALNRVIQGTEGDYNKIVLIEVHKNRHSLGFLPRFTVHDELNGDLSRATNLPLMEQILNVQYRPELKVPIFWDAHVGSNWMDAKGD